MTTDQIQNYLTAILIEAGVDPVLITNQARLGRDLGLDSLEATDLLPKIEDYFAIHIPDEDWWQLKTVGQVISHICRDQVFSEC